MVADFDTAYHAILGRPALAKFMVIPHYAYLVMKMLAERGILSLRANIAVAYACERERESLALAEALDLSARMDSCLVVSKEVPMEEQEIPMVEAPRAAMKAKETKDVDLVIGDKNKTAKIGANLNPK
ncbi:uncharacterized protein [Miscanthus floridulus]|uniref:uncharacterized protein n=1 Tax=Miscanthus floridulus TaxID=154761 RepID=UPI00345B47CD